MMTQILFVAALLTAATVLAADSSTTQQANEKPYFEDSFDNLDNWQAEGAHVPEIKDGRMHLKTSPDKAKAGQFVWCKKELPADYRIEFQMTPASDSGFFLIFFSVSGVKGEDILEKELFEKYMPAKSWTEYEDWDKYTSPPNRKHESRIQGYHISYRRNELANCNLRKNPGLNLLKSSDINALLPTSAVAKVVLTKVGGKITLDVNGDRFMDHTDEKAALEKGRFGFRQVYESSGTYDNFKIFDLTKKN
jgi:hypothetical protein